MTESRIFCFVSLFICLRFQCLKSYLETVFLFRADDQVARGDRFLRPTEKPDSAAFCKMFLGPDDFPDMCIQQGNNPSRWRWFSLVLWSDGWVAAATSPLISRKLSWLAISSVQGIGNYLLPIGQWPFGWFSRAWRQIAESTKGKKKVAKRQTFWWSFSSPNLQLFFPSSSQVQAEQLPFSCP